MKILVFSDTHLRLPFEEKKCIFLAQLIRSADHVIINGDFWDGYFITFDQFINSPWKQLFPILKEKHTVYIYGNHDRSAFCDNRANLFSDIQTMRHQLESGDKTFIFEHGNRLYATPDEYIRSLRLLKFNSTVFNALEKRFVQRFGQKHLVRIMGGKNNKIKKKLLNELKANEYFVCGHTHSSEYDEENRFINSGFIKHGLAQYIYIQDGKIKREETRYDI